MNLFSRNIAKRGALEMVGDRVVVYEYFYLHEEDDDKVRGRGGYLTADEWTARNSFKVYIWSIRGTTRRVSPLSVLNDSEMT